MSYLEINNLVKQFGSLTAVDGVSFDVEDGEFVTVVGPSGCGKTTTLRMIAGLEEPTAGSIQIDGNDITKLPAFERDIGVVFQDYALFPHKTVAENIAFGLKMRGEDDDAQRAAVEEMLRTINLEGYEEEYPHELSGGEQQRVAVARALAFDPDLVLMDEPLSNLDKKLRQSMRTELKRIQKETGVTTIYVTHNQTEALSMGDRLVVMNNGYLEQIDEPKLAYRQPSTAFVADFLGQSTRLEGVFRSDGETSTVEVGDVTLSARERQDVEPGDDVAVFFRNELVTLSHTQLEGENTFTGSVTGVDYQGSDVNFFVHLPAFGTSVQVSAVNGTPEALLDEDDEVWLQVAPEDLIYVGI